MCDITKENFFGHLKTVCLHKYHVMKGCFAVGLYWQGLVHDLSKFSATEFLVGARFFQGDKSPNKAERDAFGYSSSWLHHKGRNKHHYEYWTDYSAQSGIYNMPVRIPNRYLTEMVMDRIAASKVYLKDAYTDRAALDYFVAELKIAEKNQMKIMHTESEQKLYKLLYMLAERGEAYTFAYIRKRFLKNEKKCFFDFVVSMLSGRTM